MVKTKNIAFFGTGGIFSNIVLNNLINNHIQISIVVILVKPNSVLIPLNENVCKAKKIPYIIIHETNTDYVIDTLISFKIDLGIIASYNQILKPKLIHILRNGFINIHPSYLPFYRGANPIFWQIKNLDNEFGVTIHKITEKIDDGEILAREKFFLINESTGDEILERIANIGCELILKLINSYCKTGELIPLNVEKDRHNTEKGFYNPKPAADDFKVDILNISPKTLSKLVSRMKKWGDAYFDNEGEKLIIEAIEEINLEYKGSKLIKVDSNKVSVQSEYGSFIVRTKLV